MLVPELLGTHVSRLKQIHRRERQHDRALNEHLDSLPLPRPACSVGDITLAVAQVVDALKSPRHDADREWLRDLARQRRITVDSFDGVNICKTTYHVQRRMKRRELDRQAATTVETARLPKWFPQ